MRGETAKRGETSETDDENSESDSVTPLIPGQRRAEIGAGIAPKLESEGPETSELSPDDLRGTRTSVAPSTSNRGARVRTERATDGDSIDVAASVRAAVTRGHTAVEREDLRAAIRTGDTATTIVFVVDTSTSMRPAMRAAKGVVFELLDDAYQQRDSVAFVAVAGADAEVLLPPTRSVTLAARHLKEVPTGGRTPLPSGLATATAVLERASTETNVVVLVTDGRANVAEGSPTEQTRRAARILGETGVHVVVVDASDGRHRAGLLETVVQATASELIRLSALTAERVETAARTAVDRR